MDLELKGKVALVTGGSRGIGRAVAIGLAREGVQIAFSYAANEDAARETSAQIEAVGGKALPLRFDVSDSEAARVAIETIARDLGGLHILVANAGISVDGLLMRYKDEDLDRTFRTNVYGAFYAAKAASRPMMKARWGRLLFMGSVVGAIGNGGQAAYAASKAALEGMAKSLARELASRNITSNVVAPGFIETDMTNALPEEARAALTSSIPLGRVGQADEVADLVTVLASERACYITGQVVGVNGGLHMD